MFSINVLDIHNNLHIQFCFNCIVPPPKGVIVEVVGSLAVCLLHFKCYIISQCSGMLRGPSKRVARLVLSEDGYRVFYVAVASLYLMCVMYLWTPLPYKIWEIKYEPLRFVLLGEIHALVISSCEQQFQSALNNTLVHPTIKTACSTLASV